MRTPLPFSGLKTQGSSIEYYHMSRPTNSDTEHTALDQNADAVLRPHGIKIHKSSEYGSLYTVEVATYLHDTFVLMLLINSLKLDFVKQ